ncbi:TPA: hypothetical protein DIC20_04040 [Candidatus Dependentiae bacterium]|nr:MAG: hypothetical protein US03_C0004G0092 [candidate division TM6 bacterium GW2011_GWF2_36_131]KKQ03270.1 MAG: hypothetical protein US13_C0004G0092 [candidate division TM6 bacterium GW2011_GWE2_36_25]KKQ19192.1 MAG: hypothetical protein US32_C0014G0013 [candidate division TM6 bacterium GW2011_GWA2_36_9]HBR70302.1 hypothetical protein [Candidatus Dependentiae bacterium]HCU00847.1 hypothetical protein [Candidatus Dependentiae bacterium]
MKITLFLIIAGTQALAAMQTSVCDKISGHPLDQRHVERESKIERTFSGNVMDSLVRKKYATDTHFALQLRKMRRLLAQQLETAKKR